MARRWLLTMLTGAALSVGLAGTASAQELPSDPIVVDAEVATATVTADTAERTVEAEATTDLEAEELDTEVTPTATATVSSEEASLEVSGDVEVVGNELPLPQVSGPVEDTVAEPTTKPTTEQAAAGGGVSAAPAPAGSSDTSTEPAGTVQHSNTLSADRAARAGLRAGMTSFSFDEASALSPLVAPPEETLPLVAAAAPAAPTTDLSLPVIDTTPNVPALLRLMAGLMVLGAAATWRTVRAELG